MIKLLFLLLILLACDGAQAQQQYDFTTPLVNCKAIPNAFTPNGDGVNDSLYLPADALPDTQAIAQMNWKIFDRWGKEMVVLTRPGQAWKGLNHRGRPAEANTYVYVLSITGHDGRTTTCRGTVMLLR